MGRRKLNLSSLASQKSKNTTSFTRTFEQDYIKKGFYSKPLSSNTSTRFNAMRTKRVKGNFSYDSNINTSYGKRVRPISIQERKSTYQKNSMNYDEIKRIREEFYLERHEVYTLMSEFNSMLKMQESENTENEGDESILLKTNLMDMDGLKEKNGISCKFFFEHTTFMKGILPEVKKRIVTALGLDADSPHTTLNWENYVTLY